VCDKVLGKVPRNVFIRVVCVVLNNTYAPCRHTGQSIIIPITFIIIIITIIIIIIMVKS